MREKDWRPLISDKESWRIEQGIAAARAAIIGQMRRQELERQRTMEKGKEPGPHAIRIQDTAGGAGGEADHV